VRHRHRCPRRRCRHSRHSRPHPCCLDGAGGTRHCCDCLIVATVLAVLMAAAATIAVLVPVPVPVLVVLVLVTAIAASIVSQSSPAVLMLVLMSAIVILVAAVAPIVIAVLVPVSVPLRRRRGGHHNQELLKDKESGFINGNARRSVLTTESITARLSMLPSPPVSKILQNVNQDFGNNDSLFSRLGPSEKFRPHTSVVGIVLRRYHFVCSGNGKVPPFSSGSPMAWALVKHLYCSQAQFTK